MDERLKHIRTVHFTVVLVSAVTLYMSLSGLSEANDLLDELARFRSFVGKLNHPTNSDITITARYPDAASQFTQFGLSTADVSDVRVLRPVDDTPPIRDIIEQIEHQYAVQLLQLDTPEDPLKLRSFEQDVAAMDRATKCKGSVRWTPRPEVTVTCTQPRFVEVDQFGSGKTIQAIAAQESFAYRTRVVSLEPPPKHWRDRFQFVLREDAIALTLEEAEKKWKGGLGAPIAGTSVELLGFKFSGKHVGILGPGLLFLALLYLVTFLNDTKRIILKAPDSFDASSLVPWLGAMPGGIAKIAVILTMVLLPCGAGWCAKRNLVDPDVWSRYSVAIVFLAAVSVWAAWLAVMVERLLSKQFMTSPRPAVWASCASDLAATAVREPETTESVGDAAGSPSSATGPMNNNRHQNSGQQDPEQRGLDTGGPASG